MKYRYLKKTTTTTQVDDQQVTSAESDSEAQEKVESLIKVLPDHILTTVVCSFYGYTDEVMDLHR